MAVAGEHKPPVPAWRSGQAAIVWWSEHRTGFLGEAGCGDVNLLSSTRLQRRAEALPEFRRRLTGQLC